MTGGWTLVSAAERHADHPDTFQIPSKDYILRKYGLAFFGNG